ncbi:MAG: hypothetical protein RML46_11585 [Anaerolineae bacterium]|nr:hypothetical protein [Anaerolineae bacterium]MDW8069544.1 hypothetical protein [Anaerolineae bacterium]
MVIALLLIGGLAIGQSAFAGFTPTPPPTETPPTPPDTPTPTPPDTSPPPPPPPPPPLPLETPTLTPVSPLLPESGRSVALPAWPFLVLGILALLAGWLVKHKR